MTSTRLFPAAALAALGALTACAGSGAAMMHPTLGARLAGMGTKGAVTLSSNTTSGRLCWSFDLAAHGLTGASIRDAAGMEVAMLGTMYSAKGCAKESTMLLDELETKPASYRVWVASPSHPGDLRGTLFAGTASATGMAG